MCALLGATANVSAQTETVVAEGLFREGRELLAQGQLEAACAKFAESQRVEASAGTLLNLALCYEKQGKVASAWAEFLAAARLAASQNRPELRKEAKSKAAALQPKLSYLRIVLTDKPAGTEIKLDEVALKATALGSKIPVDPGERIVTISAPGYHSVTLKTTIGAERDSQTLSVPKLQPESEDVAPAAPAAPPPPVPPKDSTPEPAPERSAPVAAYVVGGVGVVALGVGTVFALMARSTYNDADSECPSHVGCSESVIEKRDTAETHANIANVGVGVGIVGIAAGVVLYFTHDSGTERQAKRRAPLSVAPYATGTRAGVMITGVTF